MLPPVLQRPPATAGDRRAAVHHLASRAGDRAMQGRHRRLVSGAQRAAGPQLDEWLHEITEALAAHDRAHPDAPAAPFAVNQIVHKSNNRLEEDIAMCGEMEGADRHHLARRARGRQRGRAWLWRRHAARRHQRPLRPQGDRERRRRADRGRRGRRRPCRPALAVRLRAGHPRLVRRAAGAVRRDRHRRRHPRGAGDGRRPRLYRLGLHRHRRSARRRRLQAGDRRRRGRGHRRLRSVHRHSTAIICGPRSSPPASIRTTCPQGDLEDELRLRRQAKAKAWRDIWGCGQGIGAVKSVRPARRIRRRASRRAIRTRRTAAPARRARTFSEITFRYPDAGL